MASKPIADRPLVKARAQQLRQRYEDGIAKASDRYVIGSLQPHVVRYRIALIQASIDLQRKKLAETEHRLEIEKALLAELES